MTENKTAENYKNSGKDKYKNGDIEGAIKDFTKALEINSQYVDAFFNRGVAKYALEDLIGASSDWIKGSCLGDNDATKLLKEIGPTTSQMLNQLSDINASSTFYHSGREKD